MFDDNVKCVVFVLALYIGRCRCSYDISRQNYDIQPQIVADDEYDSQYPYGRAERRPPDCFAD